MRLFYSFKITEDFIRLGYVGEGTRIGIDNGAQLCDLMLIDDTYDHGKIRARIHTFCGKYRYTVVKLFYDLAAHLLGIFGDDLEFQLLLAPSQKGVADLAGQKRIQNAQVLFGVCIRTW